MRREAREREREWNLEKPLAIDVRSGKVSLGFYGFSGRAIPTARVLPSKRSRAAVMRILCF